MMSERDIRECLENFGRAWIRRDIDALLQLMTDDAVYAASVGPEPGQTFRGHTQLRAGFETMFAHDLDAEMEFGEPVIFGDQAIGTWTYRFSQPDGSYTSEIGVDRWKFRENKVLLKDAYRKVRAAQVDLGGAGADPAATSMFRDTYNVC
jgi:ketosteroid isomerase-like protein